jgi:hypothetical protein
VRLFASQKGETMESVVLSVFGAPRLTQGEHVLLTAPLPMLIATYVVIEHNGEAAERNDIRRVFFPQEADAPAVFSVPARRIYEALWAHLAQAPSAPALWLGDDCLGEEAGQALSNILLQNAHTQLQEYAIIERAVREKQGFRYWPDNRFQRYLAGEEKNGADRAQLARKTFSAHIGMLRRCVEQAAPEQMRHCVPTGKTGQARQPLVIRLPCTATLLEQMLVAHDWKGIHKWYPTPFLAGIEQALRGDLWLPPGLRAWITQQRTEFARKVTDGLRRWRRKHTHWNRRRRSGRIANNVDWIIRNYMRG